MIYIALFVLLAFVALLDIIKTPTVVRNTVLFLIGCLLIVVAGIRWETGPDWESYYFFFKDYDLYTNGTYINMLEPGYTLINGVIKSIWDNYTFFSCIIALITIGIKLNYISKNTGVALIITFLYYCYYLADIASIRQFTAIALTLYSTTLIINKRPILFFLTVLAACTIHISCIAFFSAYWLYHKKISVKTLSIFLVVAFALGFLNISGFFLTKIIGLLGPGSIYAEKLIKYNDSGLSDIAGNPYISFLIGSLKRLIVIPLLFYARDRITRSDKDVYRGYLNLYVAGNVLYFLFIISFPEITRLSVAFLYYEIFLIALAFKEVQNPKFKLLLFSVLVLFGAFRLYTFMAPYIDFYIPYKTFLS